MHDLNTIRQINAQEVAKAQPKEHIYFILDRTDRLHWKQMAFSAEQAASPRRFARKYHQRHPGAEVAEFAIVMAGYARNLLESHLLDPSHSHDVCWNGWILQICTSPVELGLALAELLQGDPWHGAR